MTEPETISLEDRLTGCLLGTALGDALGLPLEGLSAPAIDRRFGRVDRFRLLGATGFVSDDAEQSALIAQSLILHSTNLQACVRAFRRALLEWFARLPWGIGWGTLRSCMRIALGFSPSGADSAGNGAAMRAAVIGVFFHDQAESRAAFSRALAQVTHRDPRAIEGALYVAELAAACTTATAYDSRYVQQSTARRSVVNPELASAVDRAVELAQEGCDARAAALVLGHSGYIVHTAAFATFVFLRHGDDPLMALIEAVNAGGDADSIGAIVGAWVGALHGADALPVHLIDRIHDGPFGPTHLRALGAALAKTKQGEPAAAPAFSRLGALFRNLALYPVILGHGFRRLLP